MLAVPRSTESPLTAWDVTGEVAVSDPAALAPAREIAHRHFRAVAEAADRALPRAEVHRLSCAAGEPVAVSPLLARVLHAALESAARTDGLVDPAAGAPGPVNAPPGRRTIRLEGAQACLPAGLLLDLRASALALALDDVALVAAALTGAQVAVRLGGRAARIGRAHAVTDPRRVVDPRTGRPASGRWLLVEVSAPTCRMASDLAIAAAVLGDRAPDWLEQRGAHARLTGSDGRVVRVGAFEPVRFDVLRAA